jgi:fibronectin type 3 domain-containing protein
MRTVRIVAIAGVLIAVGVAVFALRAASGKPDKAHAATLTWSPSANASSYNIYRGMVSGGPYQKIGTSKTPKYVDTPLPSGAQFFYVVTAVSEGRESPYSHEIRVKVP